MQSKIYTMVMYIIKKLNEQLEKLIFLLNLEKNGDVADRPGFLKLFSCSTQLSMRFFLLINIKMPTIVGMLIFMSKQNGIPSLSETEKN